MTDSDWIAFAVDFAEAIIKVEPPELDYIHDEYLVGESQYGFLGDDALDIWKDVLFILVGHGAFIQSRMVDRGGINAGLSHGAVVLFHGEEPLRLASGTAPARSVGRGFIPVGIAFSHADERAIPHVQGN